jgi:hypothetical protein
MKLRIKGDSLRLRVTEGELENLAATGSVEERIRFGAGRALAYRLAIDPQASELTAHFDQDVIEVRLPEAAAREWSGTNRVALETVQSQDGVDLKIFVEKDFF